MGKKKEGRVHRDVGGGSMYYKRRRKERVEEKGKKVYVEWYGRCGETGRGKRRMNDG